MTEDSPPADASPESPPAIPAWRQSAAWRILRAIARFPLTRFLAVIFLASVLMIPAAIVFIALGRAFGVGGRAPAGADEGILGATFITGSAYAVVVACLILARHLVERFIMKRSRLEEYALPRAALETAQGFALGAGLVAAVVGAMIAGGWYVISGTGFSDPSGMTRVLALSTVLFVMVAVFEEVLFRGILFLYAEELLGTMPALILSGLLFGFVHANNPGATLRSSIGIALTAGPMLGLLLVASRRMWLPIGMHWAWNFTVGPVFGLPVSGLAFAERREAILLPVVNGPEAWTGGAFGPEAGYPLMIFGCLVTVVLARVAWVSGEVKLVPDWMLRPVPAAHPPEPAASSDS